MNPEPRKLTPWERLRELTPARLALGRSGGSLPTDALLDFRLAHAKAKDALQRPLNLQWLAKRLQESTGLAVLPLCSQARSFQEFLLRPDLGRRLSAESIRLLEPYSGSPGPDLAIVVSGGLSTLAADRHAAAVLEQLIPMLRADAWRMGPLALVEHGRVAIQDDVGGCLGAGHALILLGERPGLVSPDSLGAYLVRGPRTGLSDASRNCVSNISDQGLTPAQAGARIHWLLSESRRRGISGVELKDEFGLPTRQDPS